MRPQDRLLAGHMAGRALLVYSALFGWIGIVAAADVVFRGSDGSHGIITPVGEDHAIFRDAHGNTGPFRPLGGSISPTIVIPPGQVLSGTSTPFGSPLPPNNVTPAPVLPLSPRMGAVPAPQAPPLVPLTPSTAASSSGRR